MKLSLRMGCPIRKSPDQGVFAPPRSLSQRTTSFIASFCQGIHQMPFICLILTREQYAGVFVRRPASDFADYECRLRFLDGYRLFDVGRRALNPQAIQKKQNGTLKKNLIITNLFTMRKNNPLSGSILKNERRDFLKFWPANRSKRSMAYLRLSGFGRSTFARFACEGWWS